MIPLAKDLSTEQKLAIEGLLGRSLSEDDKVSMRTLPVSPPPEWLQDIQQEARRNGLDALTMQEIAAGIAAARRDRRERSQRPGE
jgi:hypothetical protein